MTVNESLTRDLLRLFVWYPFRWFLLAVPTGVGLAALRTMGDLHFFLSRGKKELTMKNLCLLRGGTRDKERMRAAREYFRNHYIDRLLIFMFPGFEKREIDKYIELEGLENLDGALEKGRGVVLVHGHFGPVHLPLVVLARLGYRMKQIGLPSDEGLSWIGRNVAFRLRLKYESKMPAQIIKADSFLRPAFAWLRENGILMITGDGSGTETRTGKHQEFDFLGMRPMFPLGPSIIAEKTGAAIMPVFITPGKKKPYRITVEPPFTSNLAGDEKAKDITSRFVRRLESYVSENPGYMHFLDIADKWGNQGNLRVSNASVIGARKKDSGIKSD